MSLSFASNQSNQWVLEYANYILCRGVRPITKKVCPRYHISSGGDAPGSDLRNLEYPFIAITPRSILPGVLVPVRVPSVVAQSAGTVEYTDCFSAEG